MPLEEPEVAQVWADVIGIPEVDIDTNFFDLGGNSLLLLELVTQLDEKLGVRTEVLTLLEFPTVAAFTSQWNAQGAPVGNGGSSGP
jgi:acyl carrier protein